MSRIKALRIRLVGTATSLTREQRSACRAGRVETQRPPGRETCIPFPRRPTLLVEPRSGYHGQMNATPKATSTTRTTTASIGMFRRIGTGGSSGSTDRTSLDENTPSLNGSVQSFHQFVHPPQRRAIMMIGKEGVPKAMRPAHI